MGQEWEQVITPPRGWWNLDLRSIWRYRDLIWLLVKRDFVTFYKQTILGPLWYVIQPLFTTGVFTVVFGKVAQISTDNTPPFLFYMAGTICWRYFSEGLTKTSNTFVANASVFGKVYFPRITVPIATVLINFAQFFIQLVVFLGIYLYFFLEGANIKPNIMILALPLLLLQMALIGLGFGILFSSMTTKYRDLTFALTFGVQLWMYATPVVYPASIIPEKYLSLYMLNPMSPLIESFRYMVFGESVLTLEHVLIGIASTLVVLLSGLILFHRVEKDFMDTV